MKDLFRFAKSHNITVEYSHIPKNESMSVQDDFGDFILMDYSLLYSGAKERTHLAHEIGHCETGSFYSSYTKVDSRRRHENRADKWAVLKLISKSDLDKAITDGYTEIWELAEHFDVTEEFMKKAVCFYTHGNLAVELYL